MRELDTSLKIQLKECSLKIEFEERSLKIEFEEKRALFRLVKALKSKVFIRK